MDLGWSETLEKLVLLIGGGVIGAIGSLIVVVAQYRLAARKAAHDQVAQLVDQLRAQISAEGREAQELHEEIDNWVRLQKKLRERPRIPGPGMPAAAGLAPVIASAGGAIAVLLSALLGCLLLFGFGSLLQGAILQGATVVGVIVILGCVLVFSLRFLLEPFIAEDELFPDE